MDEAHAPTPPNEETATSSTEQRLRPYQVTAQQRKPKVAPAWKQRVGIAAQGIGGLVISYIVSIVFFTVHVALLIVLVANFFGAFYAGTYERPLAMYYDVGIVIVTIAGIVLLSKIRRKAILAGWCLELGLYRRILGEWRKDPAAEDSTKSALQPKAFFDWKPRGRA